MCLAVEVYPAELASGVGIALVEMLIIGYNSSASESCFNRN